MITLEKNEHLERKEAWLSNKSMVVIKTHVFGCLREESKEE
jgi:hypothetical protein